MAQLTITHYHELGIPVMKCDGQLKLGTSSMELRKAVDKYVAAGAKKLIIELAGVVYVDSSGLGEITTSFTTARRSGCIVVYANFSQKLIDLLTVTKLLTVFDLYPNVREAANAIKDMSFEDYDKKRWAEKA